MRYFLLLMPCMAFLSGCSRSITIHTETTPIDYIQDGTQGIEQTVEIRYHF